MWFHTSYLDITSMQMIYLDNTKRDGSPRPQWSVYLCIAQRGSPHHPEDSPHHPEESSHHQRRVLITQRIVLITQRKVLITRGEFSSPRRESSPAKSFTFTSAPSLMSSLMRRASPRMAARCSLVSPRSLRLFTLSLVLDAEFGVPFWPRLDCDGCFGVVSVRENKTQQQVEYDGGGAVVVWPPAGAQTHCKSK